MIARLLISTSLEKRVEGINKILSQFKITKNHPDLLYFSQDTKLGIEQGRLIKAHFSLKPYSAKGRAVVLEDASSLTIDAQNSLLKILEEPPKEALLLLSTPSDTKLLPTVLSRCQVIKMDNGQGKVDNEEHKQDIQELIKASLSERFEYIEKLKEKEEFLHALTQYFHQTLPLNSNFLRELLQAEEWANQNVNIRAILEYLMLVMPKKQL